MSCGRYRADGPFLALPLGCPAAVRIGLRFLEAEVCAADYMIYGDTNKDELTSLYEFTNSTLFVLAVRRPSHLDVPLPPPRDGVLMGGWGFVAKNIRPMLR